MEPAKSFKDFLLDIPDGGDDSIFEGTAPSIMDCLGIGDEDAQQLMRDDMLVRLSLLLGIFKALKTLHARPLADQWIHLPNTNPIFGGLSPLEYMKKGGTPAMKTVRQLLDARVQGS